MFSSIAILTCSFILSFFPNSHCSDTCVHEQLAFNYFIDSIVDKDFHAVKNRFFNPKVDVQSSVLQSPIKFENYKKIKNVSDTLGVSSEYDSIRRSYTNCNLIPKSGTIQFIPKKRSKINLSTDLFVRVKKRNIARANFVYVEIVAEFDDRRNHYFLEVDILKNHVVRWYQVNWMQ